MTCHRLRRIIGVGQAIDSTGSPIHRQRQARLRFASNLSAAYPISFSHSSMEGSRIVMADSI